MVVTNSKDTVNRLAFKASSNRSVGNVRPKSPTSLDRLKKKSSTITEKPDSAGGRSDEVISGKDVEKLAIKEEDLQRLRESLVKESSVKSMKPQQTTRYSIKKYKPVSKQQAPRKKIIVARKAPPNAQMKPIDYSGPAGPKYTQDGQIVPHSIVGTVQDFVMEAVRHEDLPSDSPIAVSMETSQVPLEVRPPSRHPTPQLPRIQMAINQENALLNWQKKMADRRRQQGYISNLLQKPVDRLVMNQSDKYREVQEVRQLLDRSIPAIDSGKGYRVGSEFWQQHESFGKEIGGIKMTLTKTERGEPVVFEKIGKPNTVLHEVGAVSEEPTVDPRYGWHSSTYLKRRTAELKPIMKELVPHDPCLSDLEITANHTSELTPRPGSPEYHDQSYEPITLDHTSTKIPQSEHPLDKFPDTIPEPIFGPSLIVGDQRASWTGSATDQADKLGMETRLTFESVADQRVTSHLDVYNDGTTVVYYEWKKLPRKPSFAELKRDQLQRFYFNTAGGVILPNEAMKFPFVFKSPNAGIFTETWALETRPVLLGGASIQITLKGVASSNDAPNLEKQKIMKQLAENEAKVTAAQIIDDILAGVRTPDRSPSPIDCYITERELFERANPGCTYDTETVIELKNLYKQLFPEEDRDSMEWNLSLKHLHDCVAAVPDEEAREELLGGLNTVVTKLTIPPFTPAQGRMYTACRAILQESVDEVVSCAMFVRQIMGLPDIVMETMTETETTVPQAVSAKPDPKVKSAVSNKSRSSAGTAAEDKKGKGKKGAAKDDKGKKGGGKKDAKEKDARPKSKDPKGAKGKGAPSPTKDTLSVEREADAKSPSAARIPAEDTLDPETRKKYNEKLYAQLFYGLHTLIPKKATCALFPMATDKTTQMGTQSRQMLSVSMGSLSIPVPEIVYSVLLTAVDNITLLFEEIQSEEQ